LKLLGEKAQSAILAILLLAVGALSWQLQLRPPFEVDPSDLASLPLEIDRWQGAELEIPTDVAEMLDADFHVQRVYGHPLVGVVWLYVGYYGTERGGRPEHTPWVCYPSNGWSIERSEVVEVQNGEVDRVNELLVEREGERRLVHFWYQSNRRAGMIGEFDQALDRLISRLDSGRADGSLVRISTPLGDVADESTARLQLIAFGREIAPFLRAHWPSETKSS
jgi:EpsI family protein